MSKNKKRETIFQFKQFQIKNELSAMKVGTDGVLIGAWADISSSKKVIDIGTGTGLIALMVAQRCNAQIIGIDIDDHAIIEANENVTNSTWDNRIKLIKGDVTSMDLIYCDHIISNPPFFTNGIIAPDRSRAIARHCNTLNFQSLIALANKWLTPSGKLSFISPYECKDEIIYAASITKMSISRYTEVFSKPDKLIPVRILWEITKQNDIATLNNCFCIRNNDNTYSKEYISLTQNFYLNM